jgi:5'-3' exonuclease
MKALIDADILIYSVGFASDASAKANGIPYEPVSYALNGVKETIEKLCYEVEATSRELYITGRENFRFDVYPEYKANRKDSAKPTHYQAIREYLIKYHGAITSEGCEADDLLGEAQAQGSPASSVIITKDKDLNMIEGWKYNWSPTQRDNGMYYVRKLDGLRCFWKQMLQGDATDNIPGLYKMFKVKCTKDLLESLDNCTTEREMCAYVYMLYGYDDKLFHRNAQLLWIRNGQTWQEHYATI